MQNNQTFQLNQLNQNKYVIYYRVSTKKQGESGLGLDAQKTYIDNYLKSFANSSYEIVRVFTDIRSGKGMLESRPTLKEAVELAQKEGAYLLVAKLDRLSRDVECIANLMKRVNMRIAVMPSAENLQMHIIAAVAEEERRSISNRTKDSLQEAKRRGVKLGGAREVHKRAMRSLSEKCLARDTQLLSFVHNARANNMTWQQIADNLNAIGFKSPRGAPMTATTVHRAYIRELKMRGMEEL